MLPSFGSPGLGSLLAPNLEQRCRSVPLERIPGGPPVFRCSNLAPHRCQLAAFGKDSLFTTTQPSLFPAAKPFVTPCRPGPFSVCINRSSHTCWLAEPRTVNTPEEERWTNPFDRMRDPAFVTKPREEFPDRTRLYDDRGTNATKLGETVDVDLTGRDLCFEV